MRERDFTWLVNRLYEFIVLEFIFLKDIITF